ncbi:MAG: hypothetical protein NXI22_17640 [bacterium]|nr:hypothetical protein [bacterium]
MRLLFFLLIGVGFICLLLSAPPLLFALLGFAGVLADVSPQENREFGLTFLLIGLPLLVGGLIFVVAPIATLGYDKTKNRRP